MFPKCFHKNKYTQSQVSTEGNEKSFYITRSPYHNYYKKLRPTQFSFKENIHDKNSPKQRQRRFTAPKYSENISYLMHEKKKIFQQTINSNLFHANKSFNQYIQNDIRQRSTIGFQKKKNLTCGNIIKTIKQMQSVKKLNLPQVSHNQKNLLQMASQTNFQINFISNKCTDTLFAYDRYGPAMQSFNNELILFGGHGNGKRNSGSFFHKYDFDQKSWVKVMQKNQGPSIIPCFHTINIYKSYMIVIGGIAYSPISTSPKRKFNSEVQIFNFEKNQWIKIRGSISIRSHASTIFGNTLVIHGGIDEKQHHSNQIHFINLNVGAIQNSLTLSTENNKTISATGSDGMKHDLAHHKIVHTNEVDSNIKSFLKYDGLFCFGGVNGEGEMNNQLTFLNCISKEGGLDVRFQSWITVECNEGPKPQARKNHTLNIINKKASLLLIGGESWKGEILNDFWVFDLIKLEWKQVKPTVKIPSLILNPIDLEKIKEESGQKKTGVTGHCTAFINSKLFVFGGRKLAKNKKEKGLWYLQTDILSSLNKKLKFEKSINASINTIKDSTKSESMWNIQF